MQRLTREEIPLPHRLPYHAEARTGNTSCHSAMYLRDPSVPQIAPRFRCPYMQYMRKLGQSRVKSPDIGLYMLYMDKSHSSHGRSHWLKSGIAQNNRFIV